MPRIDDIFQKMVAEGASDLHLTACSIPLIRVGGDVKPISDEEPIPPEKMKEMLFEIVPELNKNEFERDGDTDFAYEISGLARFRANFFQDRYGPGAVFRVIPTKILTAQQLNLPAAVIGLCNLPRGLVVVTGPTGSGKSTTLAAMVDHINSNRHCHIITIEDPIEFVHQNRTCLIHQREVRNHTKSFKRALRAALRQDPDIVLVGEMRDLETIEVALETSETGSLVFGTLHTTTAASTVDRIIDQFPADRQPQIRTMLASSLKGVVAQTLCKKIPKGRVAALEILIGNSAITSCIREGKTYQIPSVMQIYGRQGMRLLNEHLFDLVKQKIVDPTEAFMKSVDKQGLLAKLETNGFKITLPSGDSVKEGA